MPLRLEILPEYVHVAWHGKPSAQDLISLSAEMAKIGRRLGKAPNALHTFEEVEGVGLPPEALQAHATQLEHTKLPNRCRSASVCNSPLAYGMARMMQLLNQNPDLQIEVFSRKEDALRWLNDPPS